MASIEKRAQKIIEEAQQNNLEPMRHYAKTVEELKKMGFDAKPIFPQRDFRIVFPNLPQKKEAEQKKMQYSIPSILY